MCWAYFVPFKAGESAFYESQLLSFCAELGQQLLLLYKKQAQSVADCRWRWLQQECTVLWEAKHRNPDC